VFSLVYWRITAGLLRRRFAPDKTRVGPYQLNELPPAVFFRPVKAGVPALRDKAERLLTAARPGDQVLFGVDNSSDLAECEAACAAAQPDIEATVICCEPSRAPNPKIGKLMQLAEYARNPQREHWIVTDSEALVSRAFMNAFRTEWLDGGASALTAGYRFTGAEHWSQRLDHLPALLTLWPGLAVAEWAARGSARARTKGLGFTLGACTGVRRDDLLALGGWEVLGTWLAEDHRLGAILASAGKPVQLAREVLSLDADPVGKRGFSGWLDWLCHQHRVTLTYRVCNPGGALGMILTHGVTCALLFALLNPAFPADWIVLMAVAGVRVIVAGQNARLLAFPVTGRRVEFAILVILASLAETGFWLVAWLPLPVRWGSRWLWVGAGGEIKA